jgi:hypothetical protein
MGIETNLQPVVWGITIPFIIFTGVTCLLRFYARAAISKSFGIDDWFMVGGFVGSFPSGISHIVKLTSNLAGMARNSSNLGTNDCFGRGKVSIHVLSFIKNHILIHWFRDGSLVDPANIQTITLV